MKFFPLLFSALISLPCWAKPPKPFTIQVQLLHEGKLAPLAKLTWQNGGCTGDLKGKSVALNKKVCAQYWKKTRAIDHKRLLNQNTSIHGRYFQVTVESTELKWNKRVRAVNPPLCDEGGKCLKDKANPILTLTQRLLKKLGQATGPGVQ